MKQVFWITAQAENILMVLPRMTSLISRNRLEMHHMSVMRMERAGHAHLVLGVHADQEAVDNLLRNFRNMCDLLDVKISAKKPRG
jgi:acetolactate synthase small subunit